MVGALQKTEVNYKLKYEKLLDAYSKLENEFEVLKDRLDLVLYQKYSKSSEKLSDDSSQQLLFEVEGSEEELQEVEKKETEETVTVVAHKRVKKGRKPINPNIPREEIIIDISEEEKQCACGCGLTRIGEEQVMQKIA